MIFIKIKEALTAKIYFSEHGLMGGEIVIFGQSLEKYLQPNAQ
jgi:hypothetical protein